MTDPCNLTRGRRIELLSMPDDPDPLPVGAQGVVEDVLDHPGLGFTQVVVAWACGRRLMLVMPGDQVRVLP